MDEKEMWTAEQAAEAWGYEGSTYVRKMCQIEGRIPGAKMVVEGSRAVWKIPKQPRPERLKPGVKKCPP